MNEEEKKAIEYLKRYSNMEFWYEQQHYEYIRIVIKLVEKLQKENKDLRVSNKKLYEIGQEMSKQHKYTNENYIPTQKVKDKIEKLNDESHAEELEDIMIGDNYTITELVQYVLQELIEEREEK